MKNKILIGLFLCSVVSTAFAEEGIMFYLHGGAAASYKSDKVMVSPKSVKLITLAPTFADYPNLIGEFSSTFSNKDFEALYSHLKQQIKIMVNPKEQPPGGSLIEELHVGNEKRFWDPDNQRPTIVEIRKKFLELAKNAYKNPDKALKLDCAQKKNKIKCSYVNVGKQTVSTVDPAGVTYSFQCLDATNRRKILNTQGEFDPNKMTPKRILIKPSAKFSFVVTTETACNYRLIVKTTDLMINKAYKDVLLGELVSEILLK